MNTAPEFVHHVAGHLGEPVVHRHIHPEYGAAEEDVVEVRNHKVGVMDMDVEGNRRQHHTGHSTVADDLDGLPDGQGFPATTKKSLQ